MWCRVFTIHSFSKQQQQQHSITLIMCMEEVHHQAWGLHTVMDIPCRHQGEHFLQHPNVSMGDRLTFTTLLLRWIPPLLLRLQPQLPSPPPTILPLLSHLCYNLPPGIPSQLPPLVRLSFYRLLYNV